MLYRRLDFPLHNELNPIFVAFLGFISNIFSFVRYLNEDEKKKVKKEFSFMSAKRYNSRYDFMQSYHSIFN